MIGNLIGLLVLIALVVLFGWLTVRAWKAKRAWVKWVGGVLAGLLTVVFALAAVTIGRGLYLMYAPRSFPIPSINVTGTADEVARGEHLAQVVCAPCHTTDGKLPLSGGRNLSDDVRLPLGDLYPPNLTPAGELATWSDGEILRAIRQGTHKNSRPLGMPVQRLKNLSDADAQAVVAYLRKQPAVQNDVPPTNGSLVLAFFLGAGLFNIDAGPIDAPITAPPKAPTVEYGAYIASYTDCRDCHGEKLDGKPSGPVPPGPSLKVVQGWTLEQFAKTLRTGVNPYGHQLQPPMPWQTYGKMDDVELEALYSYLRSLP